VERGKNLLDNITEKSIPRETNESRRAVLRTPIPLPKDMLESVSRIWVMRGLDWSRFR
jgi:hypothetical protein